MRVCASIRLLLPLLCLGACTPVGRLSPTLASASPVLSVEAVVNSRQQLVGERIRVRGCLSLLCSGRDCYGWLGTDGPQQVGEPNPLQRIAVENNSRIEREIFPRQAAMQHPRLIVEGTFENRLYPEGLKERANIDPADNTLLVGPLRDAVIVQILETTCLRQP